MPEEVKETESTQVDSSVDTRTNDELDEIADRAGVQSTNRERSMTKAPEKAAAGKEEEFQLTVNGKPVKGTREQVLKWAQQGYTYPQLATKLNQEKAKFQQDREEWEKKWGVYREIDQFAAQNKDWWELVNKAWQNRTNPQAVPGVTAAATPGATPAAGQPDPHATRFQTLEQKLAKIEQERQQERTEREKEAHELKQKAEHEKLDQDVKSFREQHADLDWDILDENGMHLESRILKHGVDNGIKSFRAAARDLLHDDLLSKAQSQGKLAVAKGIQTRTKLGVLGESPTSLRTLAPRQKDIRKTSYEDIAEEIKADLRAGRV